MITFYGLAIAIASWFLRIFVQLKFIATVWEEIIYSRCQKKVYVP